jgi:hypothetical protein
LPNEDPNRYRQLFAAFAHAIRPTDVLECVWLKDYVDLQWEILRYREWKRALIEGTERDAIKSLLKSWLDNGTKTQEEIESQAARLARDWATSKEFRDELSGDMPRVAAARQARSLRAARAVATQACGPRLIASVIYLYVA